MACRRLPGTRVIIGRKKCPLLADVPQPLPAAPPAVAKGNLVKAFNYEFTAPWTGKTTQTPSLTGVIIRFDSGQAVFFYDPDTLLDSLRQMKSSSPLQYQKFVNFFSDHPIESNYGFYDAVYGAAPSEFSPIMMSRDAMRMNELLIWKLGFGIDVRGGLSSFKWGTNRGFQFGDPAKGPVALRVFSDRDQQFRFIFVVAQTRTVRSRKTISPASSLRSNQFRSSNGKTAKQNKLSARGRA